MVDSFASLVAYTLSPLKCLAGWTPIAAVSFSSACARSRHALHQLFFRYYFVLVAKVAESCTENLNSYSY